MGTYNAKQFEVHMFKEDIDMMKDLVRLHPRNETGGDLFGLWTDNVEPVLHIVLGPAIGCTRTEVSFFQSIPYLQRVGELLTTQYQLCHIGEWHSHHQLRLSEPSSGDSSTVIRNFPRETCGFLLIIANILPNGEVTLSPYLYKEGRNTYERCAVKVLSGCSPFRKLGPIIKEVEKDKDKSTTAIEYRPSTQEWQKISPPSRPAAVNSEEDKECVYMFQEDRNRIQKQVALAAGNKIEGALLGLWTNDDKPVLHIVLEPDNKKETQLLHLNQPPTYTIQPKGCLVKGYPLEDIGKYILCPNVQLEPSPEESSKMFRDYPVGGVLIFAYKVCDDSGEVAISSYLYNKPGSLVKPQQLVMKPLPGGNVFSQTTSDSNGKDQERSDAVEKMDIDEPRPESTFV